METEKETEAKNLADFEACLARTMETCRCSKEDALRYAMQSEQCDTLYELEIYNNLPRGTYLGVVR